MLPHHHFLRFFAICTGALLLLGAPFAYAEAATLSVTPETGTYGIGKTFTAQIIIDSAESFNSASAKLSFDKDVLSVQSVSKSSSAFSLWAVEPSFSNTEGIVDLEGGNISSLSGKKTFISITFKGLKEGTGKVSFISAAVLAADGKGTDIAGAKSGAEFTISASAVNNTPPSTPQPEVSALGPKPGEPDVLATTHVDENLYYNAPKARFTWDLPPDVTVVRMALDTKSDTIPTTSYDPAIDEKEFDQLVEGVMYFHIRYKNDAGWGPTAHKKIMIDKIPPSPFSLAITVPASSTDAVIKFQATDTPSGIDRYEISVDGGLAIKVALSDIKDGGYTLSAQSGGEHNLTLRAYDKAGNFTAAEGKFTIDAPTPASLLAKAALDEEPKPTDWALILNFILVAVIAFLIGYILYEQKAFRKEKYVTKRESDELRDSLANVFAALREEIDEQTSSLFQKPNPSAQDREVAGNINEAIDLSEELISKEVEDVRKLLM